MIPERETACHRLCIRLSARVGGVVKREFRRPANRTALSLSNFGDLLGVGREAEIPPPAAAQK